MDQALNGPDPRFVSYRENGKDKPVENISLDHISCHNYIGKMRVDGEWTYSDEVISALLSYFILHTPKDEKIVIELANGVSELLNDKPEKWEYRGFEDQKNHILSLAKEINKKRAKDIEIVDIEQNNSALFWVLRAEWVAWLQTEGWQPQLSQTKFTSLEIAKYLYRICQNDPEYFQSIKDLKPKELKDKTGDSDYYGLVELAIRINALLHGITLQWGVARQKKYDALLLKHINTKNPDYPLLHAFKKFCEDKLGDESFGWLYFDTEKAWEFAEKLASKNKILSKTRTITAFTVWAILSVLWTDQVGKYMQSQKIHHQQEETIKEIFENKKVERSWDMSWGEYKGSEKIDKIHEYVQKIYNRFIFRYGSIGNFSQEQFNAKIVDCLNNQDALDKMSNYDWSMISIEDEVIDNYLLPNNIGEFKTAEVSTIPYEKYIPYTQDFINTLLIEKDFESNWDERGKSTVAFRWVDTGYPMLRDLGEYSLKNIWYYGSSLEKYRLALTTNSNTPCILATGAYYQDFDKKDRFTLSTQQAKNIAIDFLKQTQPLITITIDEYLMRYYGRDNSHSLNSKGYEKATLPWQLEEFLIKDFIRQGMLDKIPKDLPPEIKINKVVSYLDNFVVANQNNLSGLKWSSELKLAPNAMFEEYEEAMQNTIKDYDQIFKVSPWLAGNDLNRSETSVQYIWKYKSSTGKIYSVGYTIINNKKYLFANDLNSNHAIFYTKNSFGIYDGNAVAQDYFKTKSDFLKKKYEFENKFRH